MISVWVMFIVSVLLVGFVLVLGFLLFLFVVLVGVVFIFGYMLCKCLNMGSVIDIDILFVLLCEGFKDKVLIIVDKVLLFMVFLGVCLGIWLVEGLDIFKFDVVF